MIYRFLNPILFLLLSVMLSIDTSVAAKSIFHTENCTNPPPGVQTRTSNYYSAPQTCRGRSNIRPIDLPMINVNIERTRFYVDFYSNRNLNAVSEIFVDIHTTTGTIFTMTRTSAPTLVIGPLGNNWYHWEFEYDATALSDLVLDKLQIRRTHSNNNSAFFMDDLTAEAEELGTDTDYMRFPGTDTFTINDFDALKVATRQTRVDTFNVRGRIPVGSSMVFRMVPPAVHFFYLRCTNVTIDSTGPSGTPATTLTASCLPPRRNQATHPLFEITNTSGLHVFPVDIQVTVTSQYRARDTVTSDAFSEVNALTPAVE